MKFPARFALASAIAAVPQLSAAEWPALVLSNQTLRMTAHIPGRADSFYRGNRFARCSMLDGVEAGGAAFYTRHYDGAHEPEKHDAVCGPAEEFDLATPPPGYADSPDGLFVKIGVGVLKRPEGEAEYVFHNNYEMADHGVWTHETRGGGEVVFRHRVALPDGSYGADYTHRVVLDESEARFRIIRELKNTGSKAFATRHYNHQFIRIADTGIGPDYALELPFTPDVDLRAVLSAPLTETYWSPLTGYDNVATNAFTVRCGGRVLHTATDLPIADFVLYATSRIICPEVFVDIALAPGEEKTWTTVFTFKTNP